jgi:hypothetical protein
MTAIIFQDCLMTAVISRIVSWLQSYIRWLHVCSNIPDCFMTAVISRNFNYWWSFSDSLNPAVISPIISWRQYYFLLFHDCSNVTGCFMAEVLSRIVSGDIITAICFMMAQALLFRIVSWRQYYLGLYVRVRFYSDYFVTAVLWWILFMIVVIFKPF